MNKQQILHIRYATLAHGKRVQRSNRLKVLASDLAGIFTVFLAVSLLLFL